MIRGIAAALLLAPPLWAQSDPPTTGDLIEDARLIITSDKGDVRLWDWPPRVLVLTDDLSAWRAVSRIRMRLEAEVTRHDGRALFGAWQRRSIPESLGEGPEALRLRLRQGTERPEIAVRLGEALRTEAEIVIVVAGRRDVAVLNGLWGMPPQYTRSQMQGGKARCFYQARSRKGVRFGAYISVVSGPPEDVQECLWEEVLHSLGPLVDAKGSVFFSFDDAVGMTAEKQSNDIALIRALYESGVQPGGAPHVALAWLADQLELAAPKSSSQQEQP